MDENDVHNNLLKDRKILIRGAGEMASGVACRLYRSNLKRILMLEIPSPLAVRRRVSFCEAVHAQSMVVEGIEAVRVVGEVELPGAWEAGKIAVRVDPQGESLRCFCPDVLVDATLSKQNLGISILDAPLVIALGPGFVAGRDCHVVIETNRGHNLGRLISKGTAEANTGIPGNIGGYTYERVLRSPTEGIFAAERQIGDFVRCGEIIGRVGAAVVTAQIEGVLRGVIRSGSTVSRGLKLGDIDPRGEAIFCHTVSEKARAIGGSVLEAILAAYNN